LVAGFRDHLDRFRRQPRSARALIESGSNRTEPNLDPVELAAYMVVSQTILNLDESINKE
jgi:hypothetical protein